MTWTEEMDNRLVELWPTGLSASKIASELGVSKNAVLGRKYRLHLTQRKQGPAKEVPKRLPKVVPPSVGEPPRQPVAPPRKIARPVGILELEAYSCRWPEGQPGMPGFSFCGEFAPDQPYCAAHQKRAYCRRSTGE